MGPFFFFFCTAMKRLVVRLDSLFVRFLRLGLGVGSPIGDCESLPGYATIRTISISDEGLPDPFCRLFSRSCGQRWAL